LALRWFPRIVGLRNGELVFDRPNAEVTPAMLETLYASEGGLAAQHAAGTADVGIDTFAAPPRSRLVCR
ncbi:MAG: transporter related protein, partial [Variovorax sp.]|nr:transporter related protein [Variovorax sp.]